MRQTYTGSVTVQALHLEAISTTFPLPQEGKSRWEVATVTGGSAGRSNLSDFVKDRKLKVNNGNQFPPKHKPISSLLSSQQQPILA